MERVLLALICLLSWPGAGRAAQISPTWQAMSAPDEPRVFKIVQFIGPGGGGKDLVLLDAGKLQGVVTGELFKTYRLSGPGGPNGAGMLWVQTGQIKVIEVQEDLAVAQVEVHGSMLATALFPKFPRLMAGDLVSSPQMKLERRQALLPTMTLSYNDLFSDPKSAPGTFELKGEGLEALKAATKEYAQARMSMLMVEGYTDHNGPANANQVESYQRAMTVRQYLIDELGFDPKRVVAIGYGEAEPADESMAPGYVEANRRIVLKPVPLAPPQ